MRRFQGWNLFFCCNFAKNGTDILDKVTKIEVIFILY